jgi:HAD superfamily hydrolase (TIGR01549 family)
MTILPVCVFDFDGVLADTLTNMLEFSAQACEAVGYPCKPTRSDLDALENMTFADLGRQLRLPEDLIGEFNHQVITLFAANVKPPSAFPGMPDVIRKIPQDIPLGIVTGNTAQAVNLFLQKYELEKRFALIIDVHGNGTRAEKVLHVAQALGQPESPILLIGDAISDIRAARQIHANVISVTWGHQSRAKLSQGEPDFLVDSPLELFQAIQSWIKSQQETSKE